MLVVLCSPHTITSSTWLCRLFYVCVKWCNCHGDHIPLVCLDQWRWWRQQHTGNNMWLCRSLESALQQRAGWAKRLHCGEKNRSSQKWKSLSLTTRIAVASHTLPQRWTFSSGSSMRGLHSSTCQKKRLKSLDLEAMGNTVKLTTLGCAFCHSASPLDYAWEF